MNIKSPLIVYYTQDVHADGVGLEVYIYSETEERTQEFRIRAKETSKTEKEPKDWA